MSMDILIKNGTVLTMDGRRRILKNTCVGITDGDIALHAIAKKR